MIISHKYGEFNFLKVSKTAGTSIEIALSKFCGDKDIITPVSPKDEETRRRLHGRGPQNYLAPLWDYRPRDIAALLSRGKRRRRFYNHIPATKVKRFVSRQVWSSYYKFCFERNPWDRVISMYYWIHKSEPRPSISEFIRSGVLLRLKKRGFDLYTIDGQVAVDKICRFENLADELEDIRIRLGIPERLEIPRTKSQFRKDKRRYCDLFSEDDRTAIADVFRDEIGHLGYEF